jgi:hypothetical protein
MNAAASPLCLMLLLLLLLALLLVAAGASRSSASSSPDPCACGSSTIDVSRIAATLLLPDIDAAPPRQDRGSDARFAVPYVTALSLTNFTLAEIGPCLVWQLRVASRQTGVVTSLNFGFQQLLLLGGSVLSISAHNGTVFSGPFTADDVGPDGGLWTLPVATTEAVVSVCQPKAGALTSSIKLELVHIGLGYRTTINADGGARNKAQQLLQQTPCHTGMFLI